MHEPHGLFFGQERQLQQHRFLPFGLFRVGAPPPARAQARDRYGRGERRERRVDGAEVEAGPQKQYGKQEQPQNRLSVKAANFVFIQDKVLTEKDTYKRFGLMQR